MAATAAVDDGSWLLMSAAGKMSVWRLMGLWLGSFSFLLSWGWSMHQARIAPAAALGVGVGVEGACLLGMEVFGSGESRLC